MHAEVLHEEFACQIYSCQNFEWESTLEESQTCGRHLPNPDEDVRAYGWGGTFSLFIGQLIKANRAALPDLQSLQRKGTAADFSPFSRNIKNPDSTRSSSQVVGASVAAPLGLNSVFTAACVMPTAMLLRVAAMGNGQYACAVVGGARHDAPVKFAPQTSPITGVTDDDRTHLQDPIPHISPSGQLQLQTKTSEFHHHINQDTGNQDKIGEERTKKMLEYIKRL
ncbi:hypothetical protein C8R44DRAFT_750823 [Mycena epipterygia]|nr:hypothetical protein C8R44DRAFT_750823 [Mycena epipterygia]